MTISTTISDISYNGDGVTTIFAVPYVFFTNTEIQVISLVIATDVETVLTLTTDYTVAGGNGNTGTVTAVVPPPVGTTITIARMTARTQLADYTENDPFPAATHERALDRITAIVQEASAATDRALKVSVTSPITDLVLPSPDPDTILGWNGAGTGIENKNIPGGAAVYSSISTTRAGLAASEAATPDSLASFWQQGSDIVAAANLAKPADANLGGYHFVTGNTGISSLWTGEKDGMEVELRFTGTPLLTASANFIPPNANNYQVVAGDILRFRWENGGTRMRVVGGIRANGQALIAPTVTAPVFVGRYYAEYATNADLATIIPLDDTIPTSTEGTQILSIPVTTTTATQRVRLRVGGICAPLGNDVPIIALFRGTTCVQVTAGMRPFGVLYYSSIYAEFEEQPGAAGVYTYSVRVGASASTMRMNGTSSVRLFGGAAKTTLTIDVVEP